MQAVCSHKLPPLSSDAQHLMLPVRWRPAFTTIDQRRCQRHSRAATTRAVSSTWSSTSKVHHVTCAHAEHGVACIVSLSVTIYMNTTLSHYMLVYSVTGGGQMSDAETCAAVRSASRGFTPGASPAARAATSAAAPASSSAVSARRHARRLVLAGDALTVELHGRVTAPAPHHL